MKPHPALWGALLLALCFAAPALAAGPAGSGHELYANGTELVIDTEENMRKTVGNLTAPVNAAAADGPDALLAGFRQGGPDTATAVAYWREAGGVYFVRLTQDTVVYGGGNGDAWLPQAKLTMRGGGVKALCPAGKAGGVEAAELTVSGGKAESLVLSGGAVNTANLRVAEGAVAGASLGEMGPGTEVALSGPGLTVEAAEKAGLGSLRLGPGTTLRVPEKAALDLSGALALEGGSLENQGAVTAETLDVAGSLTNGKGARLTAGLLAVKPSGQLTNQGEIAVAGQFNNQGTVLWNGGCLAGDMASSGALDGAGPLTVAAGDTLAITGGKAGVPIVCQGALTITGGAVDKPITNNGKMELLGGAVTGGLENGPSGVLTVSGGALAGPVENQGSMETAGQIAGPLVNEGGLRLWQNGVVTGKVVNGGEIELADAAALQGDVENRAAGVIRGGALAVPPGKTLINEGRVEAPLVNGGTVENKAKGVLAGAFDNGGSLENAGRMEGGGENGPSGVLENTGEISGAPLSNAGELVNKKKGKLSSASVANSGSLINEKRGEITAAASVTNTGTLENAGTIAGRVANRGGAFSNAGAVTGPVENAQGGALTNSGSLKGPVTNAGELANAGTVSGGLTNAEGGSVANEGKITGGVVNGGFFKNTGKKAAVTGDWSGNQPVDEAGKAAAESEGALLLTGLPYRASLAARPMEEAGPNYRSLLRAANGGAVLRAYEVACDQPLDGENILAFNLGEAYAGKRVSGLFCVNGIVTRHAAKADRAGVFRMPVEALGSFMVVEGNKAVATGKIPKTG